jgi:K+-transporting ATPase ATPase A chain
MEFAAVLTAATLLTIPWAMAGALLYQRAPWLAGAPELPGHGRESAGAHGLERYGAALVLSNALMMLLGYLLLRLQGACR